MFWNDNENCNYKVTGINAQFGYNTMSNNSNCNNKPSREMKEKLAKQIQCLMFAITDLAEYLNTHNNDERAICLHQKYANELKDIKDKYEKVYGPLTIYCPCNKWRWIEEPWPWERSED